MTNTASNNKELTSDEALTELCEWLGNMLGRNELNELLRYGDSGIGALAEELLVDNRHRPDFIQLLDQICGPQSRGTKGRCVHRSALREALRTMLKAHRANPTLPPHEQLKALKVREQQGMAASPATTSHQTPAAVSRGMIFREPTRV